jgi:hypothetical protein
MTPLVRKLFFLVCLNLFSEGAVFSQPGNPGGNPDVPITGIEYIIGLGGLYGVRKILASAKNKK